MFMAMQIARRAVLTMSVESLKSEMDGGFCRGCECVAAFRLKHWSELRSILIISDVMRRRCVLCHYGRFTTLVIERLAVSYVFAIIHNVG